MAWWVEAKERVERPKSSDVPYSICMGNGTVWTLIPLQNAAAFHLLLFLTFKDENLSALAVLSSSSSPLLLQA